MCVTHLMEVRLGKNACACVLTFGLHASFTKLYVPPKNITIFFITFDPIKC